MRGCTTRTTTACGRNSRRYFDIGVMLAREPWLLETFGKPEGEGARFVRSEPAYLLQHAPLLVAIGLVENHVETGRFPDGQSGARLSSVVETAAGHVARILESMKWGARKTPIALSGLLAVALCGCPNPHNGPPAGSPKSITAFYVSSPWATGTINETTHTIELVLYGADATRLTPTIVHTGSSVSPASGATRDFSLPVAYTVTAADGTMQEYSVSVVAPARGKFMRVPGESLVLASTIPGKLSFDMLVSGSVTVRSTYQANDPNGIVYQEGIDYTVDYLNGTIARTMSSRIPDFSTNVLYGQHDFDENNFPSYTNHPFFIWVDYETSNGEDFGKPNDQTRYLTNTRTKLAAGGVFRIVSYGDSITAGSEATTAALRFTTLYGNYLQSRFPGSTILIEDVSKPGYTSTQALAAWDSTVGMTAPDLVLLGWGDE